MFITVTCPKCGRGIKAKKKFVLSSGGVPCLKCKIRIPVSREQVEAYSETPDSPAIAAPAPAHAATTAPTPEPEAAPAPPMVELAPEPEPVPEPEPPEPGPEPEPEPAQPVPAVVSEPAPPAAEPAAAAGPHVMFVCPQCQTSYPLRQGLAGKKIRCKSCSRIVRVAPDAPLLAGPATPAAPDAPAAAPTAGEAGPPPAAVEEAEHLPVVFSRLHDAAHDAEESGATPVPEPAADAVVSPESIPHGSNAMDIIAELRKNLADAEERANSAELTVQQLSREKASSEVGSVRRIRELEAQVRDLTARMKVKEEEFRSAGGLKRAEVLALLQSLNTALDESLQQEIAARQAAIDDLKKQLAQALPV